MITPTTKPNGTLERSRERLVLPDPPEVPGTGTRLVHRSVSLSLLLIGIGFVVAIVTASIVTIDVTIDGRGILKPAAVWPVRSLESGLITSVHVTAGDTVREGDMLIQLDSLLLTDRLAVLRTEYETLRLDLERDRATRPIEQRLREYAVSQAASRLSESRADLRGQLANFKFGSDPDSVLQVHVPGTHVGIDRGLAAVRSAEAALSAADAQQDLLSLEVLEWRRQEAELRGIRSRINAVEERMSRLTIRAPAGGVVLTDHLDRLTGSRVQEGVGILEIGGLKGWQVDIFLAGRDVHQLHVGDEAKIKIQALQDIRDDHVRGRVVSIGSAAIESNSAAERADVGMYRVAVVLNDEDVAHIGSERLRTGFAAQVNIITGSGSIMELLRRYVEEQFSI